MLRCFNEAENPLMWLYKVKMSDVWVQTGHKLWIQVENHILYVANSTLLAFPSLWMIYISAALRRWYIKHSSGRCQRTHQRSHESCFSIREFDKSVQVFVKSCLDSQF